MPSQVVSLREIANLLATLPATLVAELLTELNEQDAPMDHCQEILAADLFELLAAKRPDAVDLAVSR